MVKCENPYCKEIVPKWKKLCVSHAYQDQVGYKKGYYAAKKRYNKTDLELLIEKINTLGEKNNGNKDIRTIRKTEIEIIT